MNYIVYKTTNLINGKIYVGVHRTNPDIFDGYIGCGVQSKNQKNRCKKGFPAAVIKYGYENFKRETLFIFEDSEIGEKLAYEKEAEIVNIDFVKDKNTYNLVTGGKCSLIEFGVNQPAKKICQYTIEGIFIRYWNSITEAEKALNLNNISQCCSGRVKYCGDFQWRYIEDYKEQLNPVKRKEKSVYQFDMQGNLIKSWKSMTEASKQFTKSESARSAIHNCCNKKVNQAFGYVWSYINKFEYKPKNITAIARYNDGGEFLESYTSITEASKELKISTENICAAISGKQKHCGGYRWRYFYGNKNNIKPLN